MTLGGKLFSLFPRQEAFKPAKLIKEKNNEKYLWARQEIFFVCTNK